MNTEQIVLVSLGGVGVLAVIGSIVFASMPSKTTSPIPAFEGDTAYYGEGGKRRRKRSKKNRK